MVVFLDAYCIYTVVVMERFPFRSICVPFLFFTRCVTVHCSPFCYHAVFVLFTLTFGQIIKALSAL